MKQEDKIVGKIVDVLYEYKADLFDVNGLKRG